MVQEISIPARKVLGQQNGTRIVAFQNSVVQHQKKKQKKKNNYSQTS